MSNSKCVCCDQSREVTKGATASQATPAKSQISFGTSISAPKSTFSFGSVSSTTTSVAPTFSFGNLAAKSTPQTSFSFGSAKIEESTPSASNSVKSEDDKAKEATQPTSTKAQFTFGNPTILPSTSKIDTMPKPVASIASDNMFKAIADKQKSSSWECPSCVTTNPNDKDKCMCCETPKDGSAPKDSAKKDFGLSSDQKFSFGTPASSTFSFGSQPSNKPAFQFGSSTSNTSTATTTAAPISSTTISFGSSAQKPTFSFSATKPASEAVVAPAPVAVFAAPAPAPAPATGFQFSFGSPSTLASSPVSKDVTDTATTPNKNDKAIEILGNVLVKPAANGPNETPKPLFGFGRSITNQTDDESATKAKKRSNTDLSESNVSNKLLATSGSNSTFLFGQPSQPPAAAPLQNTNNIFGAIVSSPATSTTQESNAPKPTFSFGAAKPTSNAFPTIQPAFSAAPFSFGSPSAATTTAPIVFGAAAPASSINAPSQPIFGSNAFSSNSSSMPTLGGFKAGPTFGSTAPVFGAPTPNTEVRELIVTPFEYS